MDRYISIERIISLKEALKYTESYNILPPVKGAVDCGQYDSGLHPILIKKRYKLNIEKSCLICVSGCNTSGTGAYDATCIYPHTTIAKTTDGEYWTGSRVLLKNQIEELILKKYIIKK